MPKMIGFFFLDADEIVTLELANSIQDNMSRSVNPHNAYSVNRRGDFYGILLFNESRPSKRKNFVRLFNKKYSFFNPDLKVHEEVIFPGKAIPLNGILIHWGARMMDEYVSDFNQYATLEAEMLSKHGIRANALIIILRPILRFLWCYIARGDFLLGTKGLIHAMLKATHEYIRYAKLWEMQNTERTIHPPDVIYSGEKHLNK
jgi:(heptosyl)LPS beta-1,4-glucosyltransferase